jgi:hypothetical protein
VRITFLDCVLKAGRRLSRIEAQAFSGTGLIGIILPASVEIFGGALFFVQNTFLDRILDPGQDCREEERRKWARPPGFPRPHSVT